MPEPTPGYYAIGAHHTIPNELGVYVDGPYATRAEAEKITKSWDSRGYRTYITYEEPVWGRYSDSR